MAHVFRYFFIADAGIVFNLFLDFEEKLTSCSYKNCYEKMYLAACAVNTAALQEKVKLRTSSKIFWNLSGMNKKTFHNLNFCSSMIAALKFGFVPLEWP